MKGVIFNVVGQVVTEMLGEDAWDDLLDSAGASGSYTSLGTYEDAELFGIAAAAAEALDTDIDTVLQVVGEKGFVHLSANHMELVNHHTRTVPFLQELNDIIHPEVLKLYPEARVPDFQTELVDGDRLVVIYRSERNIPGLAIGLIRGAAAHFGEEVHVDVEPFEDGHRLDIRCSALVGTAP